MKGAMQATEAALVIIPFNIYVAFYIVVRQQHVVV